MVICSSNSAPASNQDDNIYICSLKYRIESEREKAKERKTIRIEKERKWKEKWEKEQKERFEKIKKEQEEDREKREEARKAKK